MSRRVLSFLFVLVAITLSAMGCGQTSSSAKWTATVEPAKAAPGSKVELVLRAKVPAPWHLYSLKKFEIGEGPFGTEIVVPTSRTVAEAGKTIQGEPIRKKDKNFPDALVEYYEGAAEFRVPVRLARTAKGIVDISAAIRFQLCNDGQCLPPTDREHPVRVSASVEVSGAAVNDASPLAASKPVRLPAGGVKSTGLLAYLGVAVGAGFLALLTPCVFPMIPITVSFFSKQTPGQSSLKKAFAYCFGIIGTFTGLGVAVAAIFGATGLQAFATNPYMNLVLALVFVGLAGSLFGFFEIGVPSSLLNRLGGGGRSGLIAPVLMGLTFSLTSFTCTLPFVGGVLVAASQGQFLWPIVGMLGFSTAFCLPFFLLALFPAALSKLPRSGAWLATVKAFMGFVELGAAVKFVSNVDLGIVPNGLGVVTREVFLAVWFGIALLAALYLLGIVRLPHVPDEKIGPFRHAFGAATLVGAGYLLLAINGRPLGGLAGFLPPKVYPGREAKATSSDGLTWLSTYDEAVAQSRATGKPIFIDFTGVFCTNCREMEENMFPRLEVNRRLKGYVLARLFTDRDRDDDKQNQKRLQELTKTVTLPSYVANAAGTPQVGEFTRDESAFVAFLDRGLAKLSAKN